MPKFEQAMQIDAPVEKVWKVIINPDYWPQWFPGVDGVTKAAAVSKGQNFEWKSGDRTGSITIVGMEPMKRLEVMTQMGDDRDSHVFVLQPSGGFLGMNADECKVDYTLDTLMGGGILANFVAGGNPKDVMRVNKSLHLLRKLVEGLTS